MNDPRPRLSVLILTLRPWPEVELPLSSVYAQALAAGAEIVVVDASGEALPPGGGAYPEVRWITMPGATMHQLMARTLVEGRGEILAMTEDHCAVSPDWCAAVLRAHAEFPDADLIGGVVENGAVGSLIDWANFLAVNSASLPPLASGPARELCGRANLSLKRRALPTGFSPAGLADYTLKDDLARDGRVLWNDPRLVVSHVQSPGRVRVLWHHLLAGRSSTALLHAQTPLAERRREGLRRLASLPVVALRDTWRTIAYIIRNKPDYRNVALASAPAMVVLRALHVVGEVLALFFGPGGELWAFR